MNMKQRFTHSLVLIATILTMPFCFSRSVQEIADEAHSIYANNNFSRLHRFELIDSLEHEAFMLRGEESFDDADFLAQLNELRTMAHNDLTMGDKWTRFARDNRKAVTIVSLAVATILAGGGGYLVMSSLEKDRLNREKKRLGKIGREIEDLVLLPLTLKEEIPTTDSGNAFVRVVERPLRAAVKKLKSEQEVRKLLKKAYFAFVGVREQNSRFKRVYNSKAAFTADIADLIKELVGEEFFKRELQGKTRASG